MRHLIVSDIFGRTKALEKFASELSNSVEIFDPYNTKEMYFKNEAEAYQYFISKIGLDKYTENLIKLSRKFSEQVSLIGFSVGASAIWKLSSIKELKHISKAVCFYGSQIRHERNILPTFPIELIFPSVENQFSVSDLISDLSNKDNVHIQQTSFSHGFMNCHSENYNQNGYNQFMKTLPTTLINNINLVTKASTK